MDASDAGLQNRWYWPFQTTRQSAQDFAAQVYPGRWPDDPSVRWKQNAVRHGYWQGVLAAYHGVAKARAIGNAHEYESRDPLDTWIDQCNNSVARQIGLAAYNSELWKSRHFGRPFSWYSVEQEIKYRVKTAAENGTLITDPTDSRIPPAPKPPPVPGDNYDWNLYEHRYKHRYYYYD